MADGNNQRHDPEEKHDGLRWLHRQEPPRFDEPDARILDTFPNPSPGRDYWVTFTCHEFTSLCPVTGQPDYGKIHIHYIPQDRCIESKSLKLYVVAFRAYQAFQEAVVNRILDDLVAACSPLQARVQGEFNTRGGISITVEATHSTRGTS